MADRPPSSIRKQLLLMATGLLLVIATGTFWAANQYGQRAAQLSYDRLLTGAALQMAENIYIRDGFVVVDLPHSAFETLSLAPQDRAFYRILGPDNQHLTGHDDLPSIQVQQQPFIDEMDSEQPSPQFFDAFYSNEPVRFLVLSKLLTETDFSGEVKIQVGQTTRAREELAREISWRALQFVVVFFCIALLLIVTGIWLILRPLRKLNSALAKRSPMDLSPIEVPVSKEVSELLKTINHFMAQLDATLERLKRFTSEAAHQIRTPLAGLKSQAQNALEEQNESVRRDQIARVIECSDLLGETVSQLLSQATLAHRFQSEAFHPLSLQHITKEVCREAAVSALNQNVEVAYLGENQDVIVHGDDFALKQMLRNILENAIKYSPKGGTVEVDIRRDNENGQARARLLISDQGPGIPDEEKAQVFERFYRSRNNPRSGSGLGLAIAREVAEHHQASLTLLDNQPQGLTVETTFVVADRGGR